MERISIEFLSVLERKKNQTPQLGNSKLWKIVGFHSPSFFFLHRVETKTEQVMLAHVCLHSVSDDYKDRNGVGWEGEKALLGLCETGGPWKSALEQLVWLVLAGGGGRKGVEKLTDHVRITKSVGFNFSSSLKQCAELCCFIVGENCTNCVTS